MRVLARVALCDDQAAAVGANCKSGGAAVNRASFLREDVHLTLHPG